MVKRRFLILVSLIAVVFVSSGCEVVEDGTIGVSKSFGKIGDEGLPPTVYVNFPIVREVEVWNIKTQRRTLNLEIPSAEGLIVKIQATILFKPIDVVGLRKTIGVDYVDKVLGPTVRNSFREVIGKQRVEELIRSQEKLTAQVYTVLKDVMQTRGIDVENLLITGLALPQKFKDAIERKLESEQKALQKQFELQQATKDAEIEVARAKGAAEAQKIVRSTLSAEYLQYLWISTLNENPNVIYVATEANMPVFRTTKDRPLRPIQ